MLGVISGGNKLHAMQGSSSACKKPEFLAWHGLIKLIRSSPFKALGTSSYFFIMSPRTAKERLINGACYEWVNKTREIVHN